MNNGGFTLGGVAAKDLGIIMIGTSKRPILPSTTDRTITVPGKSGAIDFGADVGVRLFSLDCAVIEQNAAALQVAIGALAAHLIDSSGRPKTHSLVFDYQPDRFFQVRYSGSLDVDRVIGLGKFTLSVIAFDPWAQGTERLVEQTITASPTVLMIQSEGEIVASSKIELTNTGTTTINQLSLSVEYKIE